MPKTSKKTSKRIGSRRRGSKSSQHGNLEAALLAVGRAMKRLKARWYLFGAQAVALHGVPRATQDVDVTVLTEATTQQLLRALVAEGLRPRFDDASFVAATRVIPADHPASGWKIDVVLGGAGLDEMIVEAARERRVGAARVPLLSIEHLLVLKVLAGRPRDVVDASQLVGLHRGAFDERLVRELLRALEVALSEDGILARFENVLAGSR